MDTRENFLGKASTPKLRSTRIGLDTPQGFITISPAQNSRSGDKSSFTQRIPSSNQSVSFQVSCTYGESNIESTMAGQNTDEVSIRRLLDQYCHGMDRRNYELMRDVFTPEADLSYCGGLRRYTGGEAMRDVLVELNAAFGPIDHAISSLHITVDNDTARAEYHVIATMLKADEPKIVIRVVDFKDDLRRTPEGWRVNKRRHTPMFQYELPSAKIDFPGVGGVEYRLPEAPESSKPTAN
jgi:hypothetical protein